MRAAWNIKDEKTTNIKTPNGGFTPTNPADLKASIYEAARYCGLRDFNVKVNGTYVDDATSLEGKALGDVTNVSIEAYDTAGC